MKTTKLNLIMIMALLLASACTASPQIKAGSATTGGEFLAAGRSTPQATTSNVLSGLSPEICLNNTADNPQCKDCCDCLPGADDRTVKSCRDACASHDFSQNNASLAFTAPSAMGAHGDYSMFTASGSQQECKRLCDSSTTLACGDRQFCRDACNRLEGGSRAGSGNPTGEQSQIQPSPSGENPPSGGNNGGTPPPEAIAACSGKNEQQACEFTWQKGKEAGVCETVQGQLACSPKYGPGGADQPGNRDVQLGKGTQASGQSYNIEQAISDRAQGMTIAFDALAFLTGDLGSDSFFPPGKVADFWGFQYLRDNDSSQMGHAGDFLTSAAMNTLNILTPVQRAELVKLAESQVDSINQYATMRFVLMDAFRRLLAGDLPAGTTGLDEAAVKAYSARLYRLDGDMSFTRAQVMGSLINTLDADQRATLDSMTGKGMRQWPEAGEPDDMRELDRDVKVAVMTYAADLFSWYSGTVEADVYFCPERHGTYFGSFYLKDRPAMDNSSYAIPTDMTGNMGQALLDTLTPDQAHQITGLVSIQRPYLEEIVATRQQVSTELRKFMSGGTANQAGVLSLMENYGELDGEIIYNFAVHFVEVSRSLSDAQKAQLTALRKQMLGDQMFPAGVYLYSQPITMPDIPNTDFLFK